MPVIRLQESLVFPRISRTLLWSLCCSVQALCADEDAGPSLRIEAAPPEVLFADPGSIEEVAPVEVESEAFGLGVEESPPENSVSGVSILIENGENGIAGISDYTSSGYSLLQSAVVAQGSNAFHLAGISNDYFSLTTDLIPTGETMLYFQSQLRWATDDQVAEVQVSIDGGVTWPDTIFSQAGEGSGETGFTLREVSLSPYAGVVIRLRFRYQFDFGSYYSSTNAGVGWHIDDIQIGTEFQKGMYMGFGDPTDDEQFYLEYINRARADASQEAIRLRDETDPLVTSAYSNTGVSLSSIAPQFAWHVASGCMDEVAQPLAFNATLLLMSRLHSQDMFNYSFQGHTSSSNPPSPIPAGASLGGRISAVGYSGYTSASENVYAYAKSVAHGHAGFDVDWGTLNNSSSGCYNSAFVTQGMQNPPGHRLAIHDDTFSEIGVGVVNDSNGGVGPQIVTQNFGNSGGTRVTGVVYEDLNANNFYDPGEGISNVRVDIVESPNFSETSSSGGYALPVPGDGSYTVIFSGFGVPDMSVVETVSGNKNVKVDYVVPSLSGYALWASNNGVVGGIDDDDDLDGLENGIEYGLLGLSATVPDAHHMPTLIMAADGSYTLNYTKNSEAIDLSYVVKTSTDGKVWGLNHVTVLVDTADTLEVAISGGQAMLLVCLEVNISN